MKITKRQLRRIIRESLLNEMTGEQGVLFQYARPAEQDRLAARHKFSPEGELLQWGPAPSFKTVEEEIDFIRKRIGTLRKRVSGAGALEATAGYYEDTSHMEEMLRDFENRLAVYEEYQGRRQEPSGDWDHHYGGRG